MGAEYYLMSVIRNALNDALLKILKAIIDILSQLFSAKVIHKAL